MNYSEIYDVREVWNNYFPKSDFHPDDTRLSLIKVLIEFFSSPSGLIFIKDNNKVDLIITKRYVYLNVNQLSDHLPFNDFMKVLKATPNEVLGCLGISMSLVYKQVHRHYEQQFIIYVRLYGFSLHHDISFGDIKSGTVDQLVSLRGHVTRVSSCRPLIDTALFMCPKCMQSTQVFFEDGIYMPPSVCITPKCHNKYLEFDRSSVKTIDYQRIKITELDEINEQLLLRQKRKIKSEHIHGRGRGRSGGGRGDDDEYDDDDDDDDNKHHHQDRHQDHHSKYDDDDEHNPNSSSASTARVPRTMEVEVRDSLVNTCVPGDLLSIVGIVKSIQVREGYNDDDEVDDDDDDDDDPYHHYSLLLYLYNNHYSLMPHDL